MSQNYSNTSADQAGDTKSAAGSQAITLKRRIVAAVFLPVWVAVGFYLSQTLVVAGLVALRFLGVSFNGVDMAVLNAVVAALSYLLTVLIVVGVPVAVKKMRISMDSLGLGRLPSWRDIVLAPAGFLLYVVCASLLIFLATKVIPGFNAEQPQDVGFNQLSQRYEYVLAFVTLVVIAPVAEEVLMRGFLYGKLRRIVPIAVAMAITAVLFAILHMQWNVAVDVFALSLVLTLLREATGSIWASILLHMMKNGLAFYILFINPVLSHTMGG